VLWTYFTLLTDLSAREVASVREAMASGALVPTEVRYQLARAVATDFHGAAAASQAEQAVRARHEARVGGELHEMAAVPTLEVTPDAEGRVGLARVIAELRFAPSTSEAMRQIKAGGVRINGERVGEARWEPPARGRAYTLAVGSKKLARLVVS
jgi:tyrosyl-tRNA synthetase